MAVRASPPQLNEIELKLEFAPGDGARIASHPALADGSAPAEERELVSIYFDTPDRALHEAGVYLRIRESGGRYVQTVKSARSENDILQRLEWEREVAGRMPDLDDLAGTVLEPLLTPRVRAALQPMFETRIVRRTHPIERNGSEIEVAIDGGEINTRTHTRPIFELELELKQGETKQLFGLARELAGDVPLRLEVKTKAERGYELLHSDGLEAERAGEVGVFPEMTAGEAFRTIALNCLRQIVANEPATCSGRPAALHQMRIGLRRLRAAIGMFSDIVDDGCLEKIKSELRWIAQELGPARDLDVLAADVLAPLRKKHPDQEQMVAAHLHFEETHAAAYANAARAIRSGRFRSAMLDLAEWIEAGCWAVGDGKGRKARRMRPVAEHAKKELAKLRKAIRRKGAALRDLSVAQRHRLRIRAKRLRYGTEFFARTFPGEARAKNRSASLDALKDFQDALGALNDLATHRELLAGLPGSPALPFEETRAEQILQQAERALARFAGEKPFWKA